MDGPPGTSDILRAVDELRELFRRRLLDDGDKRRLIDELHERLRKAESGVALEHLLPLVYRLLLVIDRLDGYQGSDTAFVRSVRREILLALAQHGVESIDGTGPADEPWREVISVTGTRPGELVVTEVVQVGFRYGSRLLRPARVVAEYQATAHES